MRRQFHMASGKEAVKTPLKMTKSSRPATKRTAGASGYDDHKETKQDG